MQRAGGLSPQLRTIQAQADAMQDALAERGIDGRIYIAMRYWHPFTEEAVQQLVADGLNKLVIVPLYPQFSLSTSGSALRILERRAAGRSVVVTWRSHGNYVVVTWRLKRPPHPRAARR